MTHDFTLELDLDEILDEFKSHPDIVKDDILDWIGKEYVKNYFDLIENED